MRTLLFITLTFLSYLSLAQAPQSIAYQGILRDQSGVILADSSATLRFTLKEGSFDGPTIWQEIQTTSTNSHGLINLFLGSSESLANINWGSGSKFLNVEMLDNDVYIFIGAQQLVSVPYALHANTAQSSDVSGFATTSGSANTADFATNANFASLAENANTANSANSAISANTADFATNANFATLAENANTANSANSAISASTADFATNANFASLAENANTANSANSAISANTADFATNAENANSASFATFSDSANYAQSSSFSEFSAASILSDTSAFANFSLNSENAVNAENANFAITAATAFSASNSNTANTANSSNVALNGIAGVSSSGDTLFLTGGNYFIIPGISQANSSEIFGCNDPAACNFNPSVTQGDNSCYYPGFSCNDGDLNSSNDVWNSECQCQGTVGVIGAQHSCGPDNIHNSDFTYESLIDQSGNLYKTVEINGTQWMAENLKTDSYANGDAIAFNLNNSQWQNISTGAWSNYDNNASAECPYGKLYNWYAVSDPRGICPTGWRVPSLSDWNNLVTFLDESADTTCSLCTQSTIAGGALKSANIAFWETNIDATNASGFSALPSGFRSSNGSFANAGYLGFYWTSTDYSSNSAYSSILYYNSANLRSNGNNKRTGFAVRCIQD
jgi:uncharacterized protein (TIGR02145 family)